MCGSAVAVRWGGAVAVGREHDYARGIPDSCTCFVEVEAVGLVLTPYSGFVTVVVCPVYVALVLSDRQVAELGLHCRLAAIYD